MCDDDGAAAADISKSRRSAQVPRVPSADCRVRSEPSQTLLRVRPARLSPQADSVHRRRRRQTSSNVPPKSVTPSPGYIASVRRIRCVGCTESPPPRPCGGCARARGRGIAWTTTRGHVVGVRGDGRAARGRGTDTKRFYVFVVATVRATSFYRWLCDYRFRIPPVFTRNEPNCDRDIRPADEPNTIPEPVDVSPPLDLVSDSVCVSVGLSLLFLRVRVLSARTRPCSTADRPRCPSPPLPPSCPTRPQRYYYSTP